MPVAIVPSLNVITLDTHDPQIMSVGDASLYPTVWNIQSPTITITPPAFPPVTLTFTPRNIMIINSDTLGLTCTDEGGCLIDLPDGIYKVKYSIYPAYTYFIEKYFLKVDALLSRYDTAYLKLDIFQCDGAIKKQDEKILDDVGDYIEGAIAAANKCAQKLSIDLYNKANKLLTDFLNNRCYT